MVEILIVEALRNIKELYYAAGGVDLLRWLAAGAVALHAVHEQGWHRPPYQRFRSAVNRSLQAHRLRMLGREATILPLSASLTPLGPTEATLLFLVELTVLPAAVLFGGPLGALAAWSFMGIDRAYTHGERQVPGGWSALLAFLLLSLLLWPLWPELLVVVVGFAALRLPWWRWRRKVE